MRRLTEPGSRIVNGQECQRRGVELYWRLKKYEDTGMSPEEINELKGRLELVQAGLDALVAITNGISCIRLNEITAAEKQGRLLVMPCKVGDKLYDITMGHLQELTVRSIPIMAYPDHLYIGINATNFRGAYLLVEMWQIGKSVFLLREEAETALRG